MNTHNPLRLYGKLAALLLAIGGTALPARAQQPAPLQENPTSEAAEGPVVELETFVVTAQKVARPLNEVPSSVVPISGDTLVSLKLFDAKDIVAVAPGLDVNTASPNNTIPSMRGMTFDPFSGVSPTVNLYWNELSIDSGSAFRAMYDLGQVEVLRGPQGTLRAGSAPGGAVLFNTRKADLADNSASVQLSASNQNLLNTQFTANVVLLKEKLAFRLAGLYDGNDANYAHNIITGFDSRSHTRSLRGTLTWKPNENINVNLVHQYLYQNKQIDYMVFGTNRFPGRTDLPATLSPFDRTSIQPSDNLNTFRSKLTSLMVDVKLPGDNELNFIGGLTQGITNMTTSNNRANLMPNFSSSQIVSSVASAPTVSYELRFGSVDHKFWNYNFGVFYTRPTGTSIITLDGGVLSTIYTTPAAEPTTPPRTVITKGSSIIARNEIKAFFTTQSFNLTDKLRLELGLRKQMTEGSTVQTIPLIMQLGALQIPIGNSNSTSKVDVEPTTGSASLSYKFNRNINAYLSVGRSFRPGGLGTNTQGANYDKYYHYNDETSDGFELGVKSSLLERKLQLNVAVFYQKFSGYQALSSQIALRTDLNGQSLKGLGGFVTNSKAEAKGVEIGFAYAFPHRIVFNFDASYAQSVWADGVVRPVSLKNASGQYVFNTPGEYISYADVGGQRIGNAPELTITPRLEWTRRAGRNEVFVRGLMKYQSDRKLISNVNQETLGGYAVCDLQAGLRSGNGNWEVTVWGKNVLGREAVEYFEDPQATFIWTSGFRQVVTTNPTEVGLTVNRRF